MGFAESFPDQRLRALFTYWSMKRGERRMPSRADIDPAELRPLLPHIMLLDVIDGGSDMRYRLVGTEIERHLGRPVTGRLLGDLVSGDYLDYVLSLYQRVIADTAPVYSENGFDRDRSDFGMIADFKRAHRLMLPLSRDGVTVDIVLCGQIFTTNRNRDTPDVLLVDKP
jgi:hypothetical protein